MYKIKTKLAFLGVVLAVLSTLFSPFLKVLIVGNWNLYEVDVNLFFITNSILSLLLLFIVLNQAKLYRFLAVVFFVWCLLALAAVYFKTNNYFGMNLADGLISKTIHFKWGWILLITSALIIRLSVTKEKLLIQIDEK